MLGSRRTAGSTAIGADLADLRVPQQTASAGFRLNRRRCVAGMPRMIMRYLHAR
jgi:hypothetical protein